jgi:hypothetical protein
MVGDKGDLFPEGHEKEHVYALGDGTEKAT